MPHQNVVNARGQEFAMAADIFTSHIQETALDGDHDGVCPITRI